MIENLENGCSKIMINNQQNKTVKILLLSNDQRSIESLHKNNKCNVSQNTKIEIYDFFSLNQAILFAEEYNFDAFVVDYASCSNNTLTLLEYLSKENVLSKNTFKVVLTDNFDHIEEFKRINLLNFANKVMSKTASYFNLKNILHDILA